MAHPLIIKPKRRLNPARETPLVRALRELGRDDSRDSRKPLHALEAAAAALEPEGYAFVFVPIKTGYQVRCTEAPDGPVHFG